MDFANNGYSDDEDGEKLRINVKNLYFNRERARERKRAREYDPQYNLLHIIYTYTISFVLLYKVMYDANENNTTRSIIIISPLQAFIHALRYIHEIL